MASRGAAAAPGSPAGRGRGRRPRRRRRAAHARRRHVLLQLLRQLPLHEAGVRELAARAALRGRLLRVPRPARRRGLAQVAHQGGAQHLAELPQHAAAETTRSRAPPPRTASSATRSRASWASPGRSACRTPSTSTRTTWSASTATTTRLTRRPGESSAVSMAPCTMCHEQTTDPNQLRLLPLHAAGRGRSRIPPTYIDGARRAGPAERAGLPALPPQQGAVLRRLPRQAHAGPLLRQLALRARQAGPEGPRPLPRLSQRGAAVQPVSHRGPPRGLGDVARAGGRQGHALLPGLPPQADVRRLPRG